MNGAVVPYVRAKTVCNCATAAVLFLVAYLLSQLGGCSSINNVAYSRSSKGAFQLFADTVGDQSWTWENVLPFYKKSMDFVPPDASTRFANATPSYTASSTARGGPLDISYPAYAQAWSTWVAKGLAAIGIPQAKSFIDGSLSGSAYQMYTVYHGDGHRSSSDIAYLRPVQKRRTNLVVFTDTLAERVVFDSKKTATGVVVTSGNTTFTLTARQEVILSAGVFQSPQLLMVSGVGPKDVLQKYNIPVVADRPGVGQGMQDHILIPLTYQVNLAGTDPQSPATIADFNDRARGPLTNPGGDFVGLEKIPAAFRANWSSETKSGKHLQETG